MFRVRTQAAKSQRMAERTTSSPLPIPSSPSSGGKTLLCGGQHESRNHQSAIKPSPSPSRVPVLNADVVVKIAIAAAPSDLLELAESVLARVGDIEEPALSRTC